MLGWDDPRTTTDALAAFGLKPTQAIAPPAQDLWPCNLTAFNVFYRLRTQWITGPRGATGLRLEALPTALQLEAVPAAAWPEVSAQVQTMEAEALRLWRERR